MNRRKVIFYVQRISGVIIFALVIMALICFTIFRVKKSQCETRRQNDDGSVFNAVEQDTIDMQNVTDESKPTETEINNDKIDDSLKRFCNTDIDSLNYYDDVPLLMQWDEKWKDKEYSGDKFEFTGCGPTCLSMVTIFFKKDTKYTPDWMLQFSVDNNYSVPGSGSSWQLISQGTQLLGLSCKELVLDENIMKKALEKGKVIIAVMGPGDFTTTGHFVVIKSYDNGFVINDPNSFENSEKIWQYDEIYSQIKNLWSISL